MDRFDPLMSLDDIALYLGVSRSTVERIRASDPTFPPPVPLAQRTLRWRPQRVHAWVAQKETAAQVPQRRRKNAARLG